MPNIRITSRDANSNSIVELGEYYLAKEEGSDTYISLDARKVFDIEINVTLEIIEDLSFGPEIIRNGGFDTAAEWTIPSNVSNVEISNGSINAASGGTRFSRPFQTNSYILGKWYKVSYNMLNYVSGRSRVSVGSNLTASREENGYFEQYVKYTAGLSRNYIYMDGGSTDDGATFSIDNVSVKEII